MEKNPNKSQRILPPIPEEVSHKKKSIKKGLSRAKHKHQYETVCLHHKYSLTKPHDPNPWNVDYHSATKVCVICGRVGGTDDSYYFKEPGQNSFCNYFKTKLIPEAFKLERWAVDDMFGKFARREEETQ